MHLAYAVNVTLLVYPWAIPHMCITNLISSFKSGLKMLAFLQALHIDYHRNEGWTWVRSRWSDIIHKANFCIRHVYCFIGVLCVELWINCLQTRQVLVRVTPFLTRAPISVGLFPSLLGVHTMRLALVAYQWLSKLWPSTFWAERWLHQRLITPSLGVLNPWLHAINQQICKYPSIAIPRLYYCLS